MPVQRVIAVCVVRDGQDTIEHTLRNLQGQLFPIEELIIVDCSSTDASPEIIQRHSPDIYLKLSAKTSFHEACETAIREYLVRQENIHGPEGAKAQADQEWFWLLSQDNAPKPETLRAMVREAELSPLVAIVGPKLVRHRDSQELIEFGQTLTTAGTTVHLSAGELDQGQFDKRSDVMGVAAVGMLIQSSMWQETGGLNPALKNVDSGLDLSIRTRLSGRRVVVAPDARVEYRRQYNLLSPDGNPTYAVRYAQLLRRLTYTPIFAVWLAWLLLIPEVLIRSVMLLLNKQPGRVLPELFATFAVMFNFSSLAASRKLFWRTKKQSLRSLDSLRRSLAENRRLNQVDDAQSELTEPTQYLFGGGALTTLILLGLGIIAFGTFWSSTHLIGGGASALAPINELWQQAIWHTDVFGNPVDPFQTVLALLGSLTFWDTSLSLIVLYLIAFPLAGAGAWFFATRLGAGQLTRAAAAVIWALAPMQLFALALGNIPAIILHIVLPWLALSLRMAPRNWTAAAFGSILLLIALASQPSAAPIIIVVWLAVLFMNLRYFFRILFIPIPALLFFLPLILHRIAEGNIFGLLQEPGIRVGYESSQVWELALGLPSAGLAGWTQWFQGLPSPALLAAFVLAITLAPLGIGALFSLITKRFIAASAGLILALGSFLWAVNLSSFEYSLGSAVSASIWPGGALSLYWLGLVIAFTITFQEVKFGFVQTLAIVGSTAAVTPLILAPLLGNAWVKPGGRELPALITASAEEHPTQGTLMIRTQPDGALSVDVVRGTGHRLDQSTTRSVTSFFPDPWLDEAVMNQTAVDLVSGVYAGAEPLFEAGIPYVLLTEVETSPKGFGLGFEKANTEALSALEDYVVGLGSIYELNFVGDTAYGKLWSVVDTDEHALTYPTPVTVEPETQNDRNYGYALLGILLLAAVLSIPTRKLTPLGTAASKSQEADSFEQEQRMHDDSQADEEELKQRKREQRNLKVKKVLGTSSKWVLLAGAGTAVVVLVAGQVGFTLPVFKISSASAVGITPQAITADLVCPGSVLTPRSQGASQIMTNLGQDVRAVTFIDPDGTEVKELEGDIDGKAPFVLTPKKDVRGDDFAYSGAVSQQFNNERVSGFSAQSCQTPRPEQWLLAGATTTGHSSQLYLQNPNPASVTLELTFYNENGRVSTQQVSVPSYTQKVLQLSSYLPGSFFTGVHIQSLGGPVTGYISENVNRVLNTAGVSLSSTLGSPKDQWIIPNFRVRQAQQLLGLGIHDGLREILPAVRLLNPNDEPADVTLRVMNPAGQEVISLDTQVNPQSTHETVLDTLSDGDYSLIIESEDPILASARVNIVDLDSSAEEDIPGELDWINAANALKNSRVVPIAPGPSPTLTLMNGVDREVDFLVNREDVPNLAKLVENIDQITAIQQDDQWLVTLQAYASLRIPVTSGLTVRLDGLQNVYASVSYASGTAVDSYPVPSARTAGESIWVYSIAED